MASLIFDRSKFMPASRARVESKIREDEIRLQKWEPLIDKAVEALKYSVSHGRTDCIFEYRVDDNEIVELFKEDMTKLGYGVTTDSYGYWRISWENA